MQIVVTLWVGIFTTLSGKEENFTQWYTKVTLERQTAPVTTALRSVGTDVSWSDLPAD